MIKSSSRRHNRRRCEVILVIPARTSLSRCMCPDRALDALLKEADVGWNTANGLSHNSPDYMHWYGWAPLKETDRRITDEAARLRAEAAAVVPRAVPAEVEEELMRMESDLTGLSDGVSDLTGSVRGYA